uniref:NADH dehydrogenase subunit 8 n=1 Tax=Diplonema japonicum TaxID=2508216 RepID=A0A6G5ZTP2_9EUGL|nr:NADH dehydrogenase subunit 8 [Diplonema japonicum]
MDYVLTYMLPSLWHASRSVLLTELPLSQWIRGEHVLVLFYDGTPRCIACRLCSTSCPAYAISVLVGITTTLHRGLADYSLCTSRCIYCGWCDVVCPATAITHSSCVSISYTSRLLLTSTLRLL